LYMIPASLCTIARPDLVMTGVLYLFMPLCTMLHIWLAAWLAFTDWWPEMRVLGCLLIIHQTDKLQRLSLPSSLALLLMFVADPGAHIMQMSAVYYRLANSFFDPDGQNTDNAQHMMLLLPAVTKLSMMLLS